MRPIPFQDLGRLHASVAAELDEAIARVVRDSTFVGGPEVAAFEREFAAAHGAPAAAGCASGTDALALALRALGIGPGDDVVVPSMTFVATAEAVVHVGATPVIADVDPRTLLLTSEAVERVRTPATRAVVPVHLYGHTVPLADLRDWLADGLVVVEDAAQAHLAHEPGDHGRAGAPVGSGGSAACFSFYPGKNLGAFGDGGAVISRHPDVVERVRRLRDHGRSTKYLHDEIGWCTRLDGLQAAVLAVKLRHLPRWTDHRRALAAAYRDRLGDALVPWRPGAVHHLLVTRLARDAAGRDRLRDELAAAGVATGIHYPVPLSRQPALARWRTPCPVAESAAGQVLSLPMDPLMSIDEVSAVCDTLEALAEVG